MLKETKRILSVLSAKQKRFAVVLTILMLIGGLLESVSATFVLPLVSAVMNEDSWSRDWYARIICSIFHIEEQQTYIVTMMILLIVVFLFKNLFLLFEQYAQWSFITKSKYALQQQLMHSYLLKPYSFYLSSNTGDIIRVVTSDTNQLFNSLTKLILFYTELIVCIFLFTTLLLVSSQIALGIILVITIELVIISLVLKPRIKRFGNLQRSSFARENMWLIQAIKGIKSIKVSAREPYFEENFRKNSYISSNCEKKFQVLNSAVTRIIEAITIVGTLVLILFIVENGSSLRELIPQLSVFIMAAVRVLPSVNRISQSYNTVHFGEGGVNNIINAISHSDKTQPAAEDYLHKESIKTIEFKRVVRFDDITFRYPSSDRRILEQASFEIEYGHSVGIVGASGAGKTTVVDILLGLLQPDSGKVTVDGVEIWDNLPQWLKLIAYVPQSIFICDDTVKANVAFGVNPDDISDEKVWAALEEAQLAEFVRSCPDGLDTYVGEAGIRLSGGQIQRIGIARALYTDPKILVFDEATSSLDSQTELSVMETIKMLKGTKTMVIIAHRLSTIEHCDEIYLVADGKISREVLTF